MIRLAVQLASWPGVLAVVRVFGNPFCWDDDQTYSFDRCCGSRTARCWGEPFSWEACCHTATRSWMVRGGDVKVKLNLLAGPWGARATSGSVGVDEKFKHRCAITANGTRLIRPALPRSDVLGFCQTPGGFLNMVEVCYTRPGGQPESLHLALCATGKCLYHEVAAVLAPEYVGRLFHQWERQAVVQLINVQVSHHDGPAYRRVGILGASLPPATDEQLAAYVHLMAVCGRCRLKLYGEAKNGGYMMCHVGSGVLAAYSYGIAGARETWSNDIAAATGAVVHQYDCINRTRPPCAAPCTAVFHEECLVGHDRGKVSPAKTLSEHVVENGHAAVSDPSLLLKVDIEGSEWDVFDQVEEEDLQRFSQIVLELHHDRPYHRLSDAEALGKQLAVMQKLLRSFVIVHIAVNRACMLWQCLEVSFARRALVRPCRCSAPAIDPHEQLQRILNLRSYNTTS